MTSLLTHAHRAAVDGAKPQKTKKQEGSLNVLKLLATITIVFAHYQQTSGTLFENGINFFHGEFNWGYMVELFFILSGYFTYSYARRTNAGDTFFSFWWKKYMRFLPLLFITGLATCGVLCWRSIRFGSDFYYSLWACLGGMFGFGRWFTTDSIINNPTWYIDVLLLCYAVFYYATYLAKKNNSHPAAVYLVVACVGILMYEISIQYKFTVPFFSTHIARGLFSFFLGLLLRELLDTFTPHEKPLWIVLSALYVLGFTYLYMKHNDFVAEQQYYLLTLTVFPTLIILFKIEFLQNLFSGRFFTDLSGITYHTFMWHTPIRYLFIYGLRLMSIPYKTRAAMYLCLVISFVVGTLSFAVETRIKKKRT